MAEERAKRKSNERRFDRWTSLSNGNRRYFLTVPGREGGRAVYIKEVDMWERTLRFTQRIYDKSGRLVAVHQKYPTDTGHQGAEDE